MAHEQLRRMINEPTEATYTDLDLLAYMVDFDEDLNAVASAILLEKASALQLTMYDYATEGERFQLSQVIKNIQEMAAKYASKRKGTSSRWIKDPVEESDEETVQTG